MLFFFIQNVSHAQWGRTTTPSMHTADKVEIGVTPGIPNAWLNTYSNNCVLSSPSDPFPPLTPTVTNHIRISQIGEMYSNPLGLGGSTQTYDCTKETHYYFKTDVEGSKLVLDYDNNRGGSAKYLTFVGNDITIHQNTLVDADLTANNLTAGSITANNNLTATNATLTNATISNAIVTDLTASTINTGTLVSNALSSGTINAGGHSRLGRLSIGTFKPNLTWPKMPNGTFATYELSVDGTIVSKKAIVQITNWADKVFDKNYKLMSLGEIESYVTKNKHLPEIPSEQEVIENGVDVGEMNKLLLQKVEELTLHLIAQEKKIAKLESKFQSISK